MPSPQLPNYLRPNRKRIGLSQGDVAFLLGQRKSSQVSRYEGSQWLPSLKTALALEAIYRMPLSEIFGGLYQEAEQEVAKRAKELTSKPESQTEKDALRRRLLRDLASSAD